MQIREIPKESIIKVMRTCNIHTARLAKELLILAGGNVDLVIDISLQSGGLDQTKAAIIDYRLSKLER